MERHHHLLILSRMLVVLMGLLPILLTEGLACEACNRLFLAQLQGPERSGTLVSNELLATIAAQEHVGRNNPASAFGIAPGGLSGSANLTARMGAADTGTAYSGDGQATPVRSLPAGQSDGRAVASLAGEGGGQAGLGSADFIDIISRDNRLPIPATSFVPQNSQPDKRVRITLQEGDSYIGNNVMYKGFTTDNKIPGPTIIVDEGDIVAFTIVNDGDIPHGASIHAAYTQTSKYLGKIEPGDSATVVFRATLPGVYMYHCAPGGHAIPMHIIFGQYGMMVVRPKQKFELERILNKEPDIEIFLLQHEYYASGKDAVDGQGKPMYTAFNGKLFRYVEEPIIGRPGDYVRINFLNAGPNLVSTFHIVGIVWDFAYWQGNPVNRFVGGQTVTAGPSDSWVVEFRIPPDEGSYLMLSHAVGSTDRGALGLLICDRDAPPAKTVLSDGIVYSEAEMDVFREQALRTITPFGIGSPDVDVPVVYGPETDEVIVRIIGNSYHPKVIHVAPGTTVRWINEDVFTYMEGEFSGIHNVIVKTGPERFASTMLAHAESWSQTLTAEGEYTYICTPHPYMEGRIVVNGQQASDRQYANAGPTTNSSLVWFILVLAALALMVAIIGLIPR
ncbi:MAG: multicopper oxidase domain-containing protein [Bacteroidales bacterium]